MPVLTTDGPRRLIVLAMLACSMLPAAAAAKGPDRWVAEKDSRRAALPVGSHATIQSGKLACEEFEWTMTLQLREAVTASEAKAELLVDGNAYPAKAALADKAITLAIGRDLLEPLMAGQRLQIDFAGELDDAVGDLTVSLRGSRRAVRAVEAACAKRDMSAYEEVRFSADRKNVELVKELRARDISAFTYATTAKPKIEAASISLGDERRLVFTRLCGSWWYYGASGCNITAFAEFPPERTEESGDDQPQSSWREVYDSENAQVYLDPNSEFEGWPDIVSLPTRVDDVPKVWRWEDGRYAFQRIFGAKEEEKPAEPEAVEKAPAETPVAAPPAAPAAADKTEETPASADSVGKPSGAPAADEAQPKAATEGATSQPADASSGALPAEVEDADEKPAPDSASDGAASPANDEAGARPEPEKQPQAATEEEPASELSDTEAAADEPQTPAEKPSETSGTANN